MRHMSGMILSPTSSLHLLQSMKQGRHKSLETFLHCLGISRHIYYLKGKQREGNGNESRETTHLNTLIELSERKREKSIHQRRLPHSCSHSGEHCSGSYLKSRGATSVKEVREMREQEEKSTLRLSCIMAKTSPPASLSSRGFVASGVTSLGENPVPPGPINECQLSTN